MSVSVSRVLGSDPEALTRASGDLGAAASQVDTQIAAQRSHLASLAASWTGTSSDTAQDHAEEMIGDQTIYRDKLTSLQTELSSAGEDLARFRKEVDDHVNSAEANYFEVHDDGSVSLGTKLKILSVMSPVLAVKYGLRRLAMQTAIQTALQQFEAADTAAAEALRRIDRG